MPQKEVYLKCEGCLWSTLGLLIWNDAMEIDGNSPVVVEHVDHHKKTPINSGHGSGRIYFRKEDMDHDEITDQNTLSNGHVTVNRTGFFMGEMH
jgi:hypothetical protein